MKQEDQFPNWYQSWWWVKQQQQQQNPLQVSMTQWDLVNILNFKMSMKMCKKMLYYICACFLETL